MGRPLNKKFFGNRNIGTTGSADNGIGGEGVASVSVATQGSININNTYPSFPALTAAAPTLPGGVTATFAVTWEIESITVGGTNTGYTINQTGAAVTDLNGLYSQASVVPVLTINTNGSGNVSAINITSRGEFTTINGSGLTSFAIAGAGGSNAQATVKFRVKAIAVTNKGSGYVTAPSLSWGTLGGTTPSGQTPSLTTDSGSAFSATNQENAIIAYAYIPASGTTGYISGAGGSSSVIADIQKQTNDRRYRVKTAQGVGLCKLVAAAPAAGQMTIKATDQAGKTYYVTKLTANKAVLVPYGTTGHQFPVNSDGTYKSAKWALDAAVAPSGTETGVVLIENA